MNNSYISKIQTNLGATLSQLLPLMAMLSLFIYYTNYKSQVEISKRYKDVSIQMQKSTSDKIKSKQESLALIAIAASHDTTIKEAIKRNNNDVSSLKKLADDVCYLTDYKNVWFQIIDKDGKSFYRTWESYKGDDLKSIRPDIREALKTRKIMTSIGIGKFDMTYKILVPIFDNDVFLGIFETMAKFNSVAIKLSQEDIDCLVIGDKKYKQQLTHPFSDKFIGDYYVANKNAKDSLVRFAEKIGVEKIISEKEFAVYGDEGYLVTTYRQADINGKPLGYFILFRSLRSIDTTDIYKSKNTSLTFAFFTFAILVLLVIYYNKRKNESEILAINLKLESMVQEKTMELENQKERLAFYAHHDNLTGLPNRALLTDRLNQAINMAKRRGDSLALLFIDLDGFKQINDTYGHEAGDNILKYCSAKIKPLIREVDTFARLGGDEFVVLLDGINNKDEFVTNIASRIINAIRESPRDFIEAYSLTCSIGVSIFPKDGQDSDTILRHADAAMYEAKKLGKDRFCFYNRTPES